MVPKIHARGKSFKGAAAYLLHDKDRAKTSNRVAWTETRNMATGNPETAWKVMAATAMKQDELKEQAGVKKTGRKSTDSVLHISLSWKDVEKDGLSRDEMRRAMIGALKAIKADDRQALVVCHNDERHPHIHIIVNRVSSEDGRMLPSSNEKLALSRWAEAYEKERGQILCEERVLNNAARDRKKHTRGKKDQARHLYEAEQQAKFDKKEKEAQRRKEAELARKKREIQERQRKAWAEQERQHKERVKEIKAQAARDDEARKKAIREGLRPEHQKLFQKRQAQMSDFFQKEKSLLGRVHNALRMIDFKALLRGEATNGEAKPRRQALGEAFDALGKAGARLEALKREQAKEQKALEARENQAEREAAARVRQEREEALKQNRIRFEKERNDRILAQQMDGAKLRAERLTQAQQREQAWEESRRQIQSRPVAPAQPVKQEQPQPSPAFDRNAAKERQVEAFKEQMRTRNEERKTANERERGSGRER
jgi:hypothetical protein